MVIILGMLNHSGAEYETIAVPRLAQRSKYSSYRYSFCYLPKEFDPPNMILRKIANDSYYEFCSDFEISSEKKS